MKCINRESECETATIHKYLLLWSEGIVFIWELLQQEPCKLISPIRGNIQLFLKTLDNWKLSMKGIFWNELSQFVSFYRIKKEKPASVQWSVAVTVELPITFLFVLFIFFPLILSSSQTRAKLLSLRTSHTEIPRPSSSSDGGDRAEEPVALQMLSDFNSHQLLPAKWSAMKGDGVLQHQGEHRFSTIGFMLLTI